MDYFWLQKIMSTQIFARLNFAMDWKNILIILWTAQRLNEEKFISRISVPYGSPPINYEIKVIFYE